MKDIKELSVHLGKIERSIVGDLIEAQRKTAEDICMDAQTFAPGIGIYADSIKVRETEVEPKGFSTRVTTDVNVMSKSNGNEYNLGYLLETGTNPHLIRPVDAKALHFQIDGEDIFTKLVHHPGFVSMPHFIPALKNNEDRYWDNVEIVLDKEFK